MVYSQPRLRVFAWLLDSGGVDDPEVKQRLRATIFTRVAPIVAAALCDLIVGVTALVTRPRPLFVCWVALSAATLVARVGVLTWANRRALQGRATPTSMAVALALAWMMVIGFGCLVCDLSGDTALQVLSNVCITAILGALIARNAATPRLAITQLVIGLSFIGLGAWFAPQHWLRILLLQAPLYAAGLIQVCYKVNRELVALHMAQRDNAALARQDPLTGLPNRVRVAETLEAIVRGAGPPSRFAVICMDLDGFKAVNDTLGHAAGDAVLIEAARRVHQACAAPLPEPLLVSRMGGDEFLVVLSAPAPGQAEVVARAIGQSIRAPFRLPGAPSVRVDASFGVAHFPDDGSDADAVLVAADKALYAIKRSGKGDVATYDRVRHAGQADLLLLRSDLESALQPGAEQFVVHYQPVVAARDGALSGREALVRWRHPTRGLIGPVDFIPVAEASGLVLPLGELVLRRACRDAAAWAEPVSVAVNVSPVQLRAPALADTVASALADAGLAAARLEIEVTETALLTDDEATRGNLRRLRQLGAHLVLDDFGTGYSSLSNLCRFSFDRIKIDGSFVRTALQHRESAAVVRATVALARELGVPTTAECIETPEQFRFVRECGCDDIQGYLFGRPAPNAVIAQGAVATPAAMAKLPTAA